MVEYCNRNTDLYRVYPRIEEFKEQRTIRGWTVSSGSVYKKGNVGYGEILLENGIQLTAVANAASVAAGKYYYDSDTDLIYCQATNGNCTDTANVYLWGIDWDTLKMWAVQQASQRIEEMLDVKFPIPLLEHPRATSTQKWDASLINATALMAISIIAARKEPMKFNADGTGANVAADLFLAAKNIIGQYNDGTLAFSWELTKDEIAGYEIVPNSSNTSQGMFQLRGDYNGSDDDVWMIKISTAGALGTAAYQLSEDNGANYNTAVTTVATHIWQDLANGVEIRFFDRGAGASSFVEDDTWQIFLTASTATQSRSRIGSVSMRG